MPAGESLGLGCARRWVSSARYGRGWSEPIGLYRMGEAKARGREVRRLGGRVEQGGRLKSQVMNLVPRERILDLLEVG